MDQFINEINKFISYNKIDINQFFAPIVFIICVAVAISVLKSLFKITTSIIVLYILAIFVTRVYVSYHVSNIIPIPTKCHAEYNPIYNQLSLNCQYFENGIRKNINNLLFWDLLFHLIPLSVRIY